MPRKFPLIGPNSLQARITQSAREWVNWISLTHLPGPFRCCWRAGCVVIFSASCLVREMPAHTISHNLTNYAWILSLAFCWRWAAISISSAGVYSFIMNVPWVRGCPAGWGCGCCASAFLCIKGQRAQGVSSVSLSSITTSSSLSQGFHLLVSLSGFVTRARTLIWGSLHHPPPTFKTAG